MGKIQAVKLKYESWENIFKILNIIKSTINQTSASHSLTRKLLVNLPFVMRVFGEDICCDVEAICTLDKRDGGVNGEPET